MRKGDFHAVPKGKLSVTAILQTQYYKLVVKGVLMTQWVDKGQSQCWSRTFMTVVWCLNKSLSCCHWEMQEGHLR